MSIVHAQKSYWQLLSTVRASKIYGYNLATSNYHQKLWFLSVEKGDRFLPIDFRGILTIKIYSEGLGNLAILS